MEREQDSATGVSGGGASESRHVPANGSSIIFEEQGVDRGGKEAKNPSISSYTSNEEALSADEESEDTTASSTTGPVSIARHSSGEGALWVDQFQQQSTCFQIWCSPSHPDIARELQEMPKEKRELVWADLSGNARGTVYYHEPAENTKESPENVQRATQELGREIERLPTFTLLRKVQQRSPEYIDSPPFRMQFLRSERFNAKEALRRMMRFLEEKKSIWGEESLGRDISILDLTEKDLECLKHGPHSIIPDMDACGRRVYLANAGATVNWIWKPKSILRANWYMIMKTVHDNDDVQRLGLLGLGYFLNPSAAAGTNRLATTVGGRMKLLNPDIFRQLARLGQVLPMRLSAIYFVMDADRWWEAPLDACLKLASNAMLVRTRLLTGSHKECTYQLACLGINPFPIKEDGTVDMNHHWDWVRRCQETEGPRKRQKRSADMRDTLGV